jgi:uncharacterized membrane protein
MAGAIPFLPAGTTLPPLPYLVAVLLAAGAVGAALRRRPPRVTGRHVLALAPWIALGSAAHVLYVVDALPSTLAPLAGSPTVHLTAGTAAGASWLALAEGAPERVPTRLAAAGALLLVPVVAAALATGVSGPGARWSAVALAVTVPVAAAVWVGLTRLRPETAITGGVGALAVFGHALDGVSTAVGTTQLGFGERTPVSRILLEFGWIPPVPVLGEGWVFLLVKLAVASLVVWLFAEYVRDRPAEGFLLLGFVGAVGLGPAAHNLLLFTIAG